MFISSQKKEENIAEYVLYMWQIEDVVRACNLDIGAISKAIIDNQQLNEDDCNSLKSWYTDIINKMKLQQIEKAGHLHEVNDVLIEISYLHTALLDHFKDEKYASVYSFAEPFMDEFKKVGANKELGPIEACFNALYGKLILKLQKKTISSATNEAFDAFRNVLAYLSVKYLEMKAGKLV